jgi:hypothetical protein
MVRKRSSSLVSSSDVWETSPPFERLARLGSLSARSQAFFYTRMSAGGTGMG